ncbi:hypothetical protein CA223_12505 [Sphingomonas koreensis]|jgi:hypothetical protein|uniref:Uncharacterized protein n=1 Tax=Sphingomonas koreensis TaxID=93064 RepID=A0A1L6J981_9SPHN|nr:hypothetical protein [Sphingomonas koreensis]APR52386.1 hypothetical protein BRX40_08040 [Sphingomonas koreensis]MDC7811542.1 hypothetical protein [Sphingomonas koreensis]RSU19724.1 hypothetical protein CA224_11755 [Sphingomonas koreensis]RSU26512.1 hypothetical protein CA222_09470 [Sphingomonas koreensis]RSU27294.1 hypothetical protein CA225_11155 [Sphingomonas koreensis]
MTTNLMTDRGLLDRLSAAAKRGVSLEERRKQRLSFVYGNLPKSSSMTKHQVEQALERLDEMEGRG